jgi:hypothetical protein
MKTGKQQHQQPVASTSKTTMATTSKTTPLDTKPTSKDPPKLKPAEKPKPTGKLDWSNAKTKDMKAAEAKEVKKKEEVRKEREREARKEDAKKEKEKKQAEKEKVVKGKAKERPKNEDKVGLCPNTPICLTEVLTVTAYFRYTARNEAKIDRGIIVRLRLGRLGATQTQA